MREGPIADAEAAAAELSTPDAPLGRRGKPFDRRSPFLVGMAAAAGVAVIYGLAQLLLSVRGIMILVGLALFLAVGLEPAESWLVARRRSCAPSRCRTRASLPPNPGGTEYWLPRKETSACGETVRA